MTKTIGSNFYIYHAKFQDLSDKAVDWFVKGWKFKPNSYERQICDLKSKIYKREAMKYLNKANKELIRRLYGQV